MKCVSIYVEVGTRFHKAVLKSELDNPEQLETNPTQLFHSHRFLKLAA